MCVHLLWKCDLSALRDFPCGTRDAHWGARSGVHRDTACSSEFLFNSEVVTTALELVHTWTILLWEMERAMAFAVHLCVARGIRYVQPLD